MKITTFNAVFVSTIRSAVLWFLDTMSDVLIIVAVWKCYSQSRDLMQYQIQSADSTTSEKVQDVMNKCNLSNATNMDSKD